MGEGWGKENGSKDREKQGQTGEGKGKQGKGQGRDGKRVKTGRETGETGERWEKVGESLARPVSACFFAFVGLSLGFYRYSLRVTALPF